jgi:hypothetical protein
MLLDRVLKYYSVIPAEKKSFRHKLFQKYMCPVYLQDEEHQLKYIRVVNYKYDKESGSLYVSHKCMRTKFK